MGMHPPPPPVRVVTEGLNPSKQDEYNRKHKLGRYDPEYIGRVDAFLALGNSRER
jgi:hypothetical protein